jgi:hypothetical protein
MPAPLLVSDLRNRLLDLVPDEPRVDPAGILDPGKVLASRPA